MTSSKATVDYPEMISVYGEQVYQLLHVAEAAIARLLNKAENQALSNAQAAPQLNSALRAIHQIKTMSVVIGAADIKGNAEDLEDYIDDLLASRDVIDSAVVETLSGSTAELRLRALQIVPPQERRHDLPAKPKSSIGKILRAVRVRATRIISTRKM